MLALAHVRLIALTPSVGVKVLYTLALVAALWLLRWLARGTVRLVLRGTGRAPLRFWTRQGITLVTAAVFVLGLLSIWFDRPSRLATAVGLVSAGLAFALQRVVTSVAGYLLILRGDMFTVGDRIVMGGVRGDVIALGFTKTTILEMGVPPDVTSGDGTGAEWVQARQYTGRIVTVTNQAVFENPVYNYSRDFPYLWEELRIPVPYSADRRAVEEILLAAADRHTVKLSQMSHEALVRMRKKYFLPTTDLKPSVYYRLTDNWLELTVRFVVPTHEIRDLKSRMSREILDALDERGIPIASGTYEIVGVPPLRLETESGRGPAGGNGGRPAGERSARR